MGWHVAWLWCWFGILLWKPNKQDHENGKNKKDAISMNYNDVVLIDVEEEKPQVALATPGSGSGALGGH